MNGKFDLTRVGFPIKCMGPLSILEQVPVAACSSPIYLNYAASLSDPVERVRLVMVNSISYYYLGNIFEKPLNPVLGETYQAIAGDGSGVFAEQTSHHPPTSHFYVHGPNGAYYFHGWQSYSVTPYPNSAVLTVEGGKEVRFHDGQRVKFNNSGDLITNTVMGTMGHQITGKVTFTDEANEIVGWYELGNCGRKKH